MISKLLKTVPVKTIDEIRLENLEALIAKEKTAAAFCAKTGLSDVYLSMVRRRVLSRGRPRALGTDLARQIEEALNLEAGWMDNIHQAKDPLEAQLLSLFRALPYEDRDKILQDVNFLHNKAHPAKSPANPFAKSEPARGPQEPLEHPI